MIFLLCKVKESSTVSSPPKKMWKFTSKNNCIRFVYQLEQKRSNCEENIVVDVCHMMDNCDASSSHPVPYQMEPANPASSDVNNAAKYLRKYTPWVVEMIVCRWQIIHVDLVPTDGSEETNTQESLRSELMM